MQKEHAIVVEPDGHRLHAESGETLSAVLKRAGLDVQAACGGKGTCGACRVRIARGTAPIYPADRDFFTADELNAGWRLGCQFKVIGDLAVVVPEKSRAAGQKILETGQRMEFSVDAAVRRNTVAVAEPELENIRPDLERLLAGLGAAAERAEYPALRHLPTVLRENLHRVDAITRDRRLLDVFAPDTARALGVAFDLGTTTIVGKLLDLENGRVLAVASRTNPQVAYGDDVISRISYAAEPDGLEKLRRAVGDAVNDIIAETLAKSGLLEKHIFEIVIVGNTAMLHLFAGVDPRYLSVLPFPAVFSREEVLRAPDLGLRAHPCARVVLAPGIAGYVGADTTACVLASELDRRDGTWLLIDIGTNGEIVAGGKDGLWACSTAAGPAFEGARIAFGMRAMPGAIDRVAINDDVHCTTIDAKPPIGICGTGLLDVVSEMVRTGIVDETGRLLPPDEAPVSLGRAVRERIRSDEKGCRLILAGGENEICITQKDVRELQLAKSAIRAGIEILSLTAGRAAADVDGILIAGAFGNFINPESARGIGLLPDVGGKIHYIGNAASDGARMILLDRSVRRRATEVARGIRHVELAAAADFQNRFAMHMMFGEGYDF